MQEAYEGERTLTQTVTRNQTQYAQEMDRMQKSGVDLQSDYVTLKTAADLLRVLDDQIQNLALSDTLQQGPAKILLSRIKNMNLERNAQQLDQIAKIPAPETKGE